MKSKMKLFIGVVFLANIIFAPVALAEEKTEEINISEIREKFLENIHRSAFLTENYAEDELESILGIAIRSNRLLLENENVLGLMDTNEEKIEEDQVAGEISDQNYSNIIDRIIDLQKIFK